MQHDKSGGKNVAIFSKKMTEDPFALTHILKGECAPHINQIAPGVCSDKSTIGVIAKWIDTTATKPHTIVEEAKLKTGCNSESCVIQKVSGVGKLALSRFNPVGPWKSTKWLSNTDIDQVLGGYAKKFTNFLHIPFQMRDFVKQQSELSKLDMSNIVTQYDYIGCIVNTDWSTGPGEHWTAYFIDIPSGTVEYFDSAAQVPHKEFSDWAIETAYSLSQIVKKPFQDVMVTKVEHQKENTECGVYSLYYVLSRLLGVKYTAFEYRRVPDSEMVAFRSSVFRNS